MRMQLPTRRVNTAQLTAAIQTATGITATVRFVPPQAVDVSAATLTPPQRQAIAAVVAAHQPTDATSDMAPIKALAQSAVGVKLTTLTAAQQRALLACLLYAAGALDGDTIRPLSEWLDT